MKTLQEYILEAMSQEEFLNNVNDMFGFKKDNKDNNDYTFAYNILKSANTKKGFLDGVEYYTGKNTSNIKNAGYYLAMLFDLSGLDVKDNEHIIKSIINNNDVEELNSMIKPLLINLKNGKTNIQKNEDIYYKDNGFDSILHDDNNTQYNLIVFLKDKKIEKCENLIKYIFNIKNFKKSNNNSGIGKGELLLQLLFGVKNENGAGDVFLPGPSTLEVKGKDGRLGSSEKNSTKTTKDFISKIENLKDVENISILDTRYNSCFGGTETDKNSVKIFNEFWENIKIKINSNTNIKNLQDDIFKCYIETILEKYNKIDNNSNKLNKVNVDDIVTIILNNLKNRKNPFIIEGGKDGNYTLQIDTQKITNNEFKQLTGFLYLCAYQQSTGFNYLIVFDNDLNFKCLNCHKNRNGIIDENKYKEITQKFNFTLPGNKDDKHNIGNVAAINLKK
jgi:hypothetical protein